MAPDSLVPGAPRRQLRERGHLTPVEYKLTAGLIGREGRVLTHRRLLLKAWGPNSVEHSHQLRIYLGHLRKKLEVDPARPAHFFTETRAGYRFVAHSLTPPPSASGASPAGQ